MLDTDRWFFSLVEYRLLGTENMEVMNPEGGKDDVLDEASKDKYNLKPEVRSFNSGLLIGFDVLPRFLTSVYTSTFRKRKDTSR